MLCSKFIFLNQEAVFCRRKKLILSIFFCNSLNKSDLNVFKKKTKMKKEREKGGPEWGPKGDSYGGSRRGPNGGPAGGSRLGGSTFCTDLPGNTVDTDGD